MLEKNQEVELMIEDLSSNGEGIGRIQGYALFVKDALIGEKVKVKIMKMKKQYGYAKLIDIIEPSPYRTAPLCKNASRCGGCQLQHLQYEKQLEFKQKKVKDCLERIGKVEQIENLMEPIIGIEQPYYYRNKAQFPIGIDKEGQKVVGFYAGRTHSIIPTTHCIIQSKKNKPILKEVLDYINTNQVSVYNEQTHLGLVRHILTRIGYQTGEIMVCLIINGDTLPNVDSLVKRLTKIQGMTSISININKKQTNVIMGEQGETIWGKPYIIDYIGEIKYQISPLSFYQVNPIQTKKLYDKVLEYANLTGDEIVWDLYCGIGTISLFLAKQAKQVYGVEIIPQAVEDAKQNAKLNEITNAEFFAGAAEVVLPEKYKESNGEMAADLVVLDPPRKGCDPALLQTVIKMEPPSIVYVSCDPATLARDVALLQEAGYNVKKVQPVDMFSQGVHVESVVLMSRK